VQFEGKIWKDGTHWLVEVPLLDVMTQGTSYADALVMIADAIEGIVDRKGFSVQAIDLGGGDIAVTSKDVGVLAAMALRRLRERSGLSLAEVAERLGQLSRTAYARYEQGKSVPTLDKFDELLRAVDPSVSLVLRTTGGTTKTPRPSPRRARGPRRQRPAAA
jgi:DNA-binding XRE family transcriptional regulator